MIIRTSRLSPGSVVETKKDKFVINHIENIDPVLAHNYEARKDPNQGYSKDRELQKVATVPMLTWLEWTRKFPELVAGDKELREKTLRKLLNKEFPMFKTINGQI